MRVMKTKLSMSLPKVGDRLMRLMTKAAVDSTMVYNPESCVVTYVNEAHGWYQVLFTNSGIRECYTRPVFDHSILCNADWKGGAIPIVCVETGVVYSSITDCERDTGLNHTCISRQLLGERAHTHGYHFVEVL